MGSDPHMNDLVLNDPSVMPEHARIVLDNNRYIIQSRDAQSLLVVNLQPVEYALLQDGDQVKLGSPGVSFGIQLVSSASLTPSAQPVTPAQFSATSQASPTGLITPDAQFAPPAAPPPASPYSTQLSPNRDSQRLPAQLSPNRDSQRLPAQFLPSRDSQRLPAQPPAQPGSQFASSQPAYAEQQQSAPTFVYPQTSLQTVYTETTRYLCAAAHLDEHFRRFVLDTIVYDEHRFPGETYGIDIIPVLKVAYAGRRRALVRDSVLSIILLAAVIFAGYMCVRSFGTMNGLATAAIPNPLSPSGPPIKPFASLSGAVSTLFALLLFFYALTALAVLLIARFFSRQVRQGTILLLVFLAFFWSFIPFFVVAWIVVAIERAARLYGSGATNLTKGKFNPASMPYPLDARIEQQARAAFQPQDGNLVVHSGSSTFAGAGIKVGGWSFPVDVAVGKRQAVGSPLEPKAFQLDEIYTYVNDALKDLDLEGKSELYGGVAFEDKLYVNGQEIRNDIRFLPDPLARPYNRLHEQFVEQFMRNPTQNIRFYKCVRLTSGRGEMVLSIFYRFVKVANSLCVEADYLLLPPLKEAYSQIDTIERVSGLHKFWDIVKGSFVSTAELWLQAPVGMFCSASASSQHVQQESRIRRAIQNNSAFDYGASTSLRERASGDPRQSFPHLDQEMHVKIIERQLLESTAEFLEARNVDTSDFRKRQDSILNNNL